MELNNNNLPDYIQFNKNSGYPEKVFLEKDKLMPRKDDFLTPIGLFQKLFFRTKKIRKKQLAKLNKVIDNVEFENKRISKKNNRREIEFEEMRKQWYKEKTEFENLQNDHNEKIDLLKKLYEKKDSVAIVEYNELVLINSHYPKSFPKEFDLQYNEKNEVLIVDFWLPTLNDMPNISSVQYVKTRDKIEEKNLSQSALSKIYDLTIYQIALRTLHELFEADKIMALKFVSFNGFVNTVSPRTGHNETNCIISVQANKEEFESINLKGIILNQSYKECFKALKGVGSSKLSTMTAIKPILELDKKDKRFRDNYKLASSLNDEVNIAAMDWEDFEHLVTEIFQKEFEENGGEVKVTQASSDGGVDAVAFDPDPIRGGKIVIQAKRYTNVVGVAAVRELYGTVLNEGAIKGILVTTAEYASDSYEFAKDKPITLLNGSNLLHLLQKHGHKAKIDLKEAKKMLKEQQDC